MLGQRRPREPNKAFLAFVRSKPCCVCGAHPPVQAAHLRGANAMRGKRSTGMGERPSDRWTVPLCPACHLDGSGALHKVGEQRFFANAGLDAFAISDELWREFSEGWI